MSAPKPYILIRGFGLQTPLGASAWGTFSALLAGRVLADRAASLPADVAAVDLVRAVGQVSAASRTGTDPSVSLAEAAGREAMLMAGGTGGHTGAFLGASKGAMHALTDAMRTLWPLKASHLAPPPVTDAVAAVALGPHGYLTHHLRRRLGLGWMRSHVAACASSLTALHYARLAMLNEGLTRAIVLTSEAALLPTFIHSYQRLGVLPPLHRDGYRAAPLDESRSGFMLTDCGAAMILETSYEPPLPGDFELLDSAIACDTHDVIRPSPNLDALHHVAGRLLSQTTVDVIHPHATGTVEHDPGELAVYDSLPGGVEPEMYACKGALGHALGAAGLAALVVACLCAKTDRLPPMPWLRRPLRRTRCGDRRTAGPLRTHAVFAAGFGGHAAGAVIRKA